MSDKDAAKSLARIFFATFNFTHSVLAMARYVAADDPKAGEQFKAVVAKFMSVVTTEFVNSESMLEHVVNFAEAAGMSESEILHLVMPEFQPKKNGSEMVQ